MNHQNSLPPHIMKKFPYNWAFGYGILPPLFPQQLPSQNFFSPPFQNSFYSSFPNLHQQNQIKQFLPLQPIDQQSSQKIQFKDQQIKLRNLQDKQQLKSALETGLYFHPKPLVKHKAAYFDPSSASTLTTISYNLIQQINSNPVPTKIATNSLRQVDQLTYQQKDQTPFIVYRYRRIKKKYKKYFRGHFSMDSENQCSVSSESELDLSQVEQEPSRQQKQLKADNISAKSKGKKKNRQIKIFEKKNSKQLI